MNAAVICIALLGISLLVVVYTLGFLFGVERGWKDAKICIYGALNCLRDDQIARVVRYRYDEELEKR